jgi:DNA repair exonuclease SbcCD ATPase subunit
MYKIIRLVSENMGPHKELDISIQPGLNAIIGPNGVGKSNLVRILMYALTGQVDGGWGSQTALQRVGASSTGLATVYLEGHGKKYSVTRYSASGPKFPDTVTEIKDSGEEVLVAQRRKEVDAFLTELLGCPLNLLHTMCWAKQGQLDALLTGSAATINAFLTGVFDMKHMEATRQALKNALDTVAVLPASAPQVAQEAKSNLDAIKQRQAEPEKAKELKELYDSAKEDYEAFLSSRDWSKIVPREEHSNKLSAISAAIEETRAAMPEIPQEVPAQECTSKQLVEYLMALDNKIGGDKLRRSQASALMESLEADASRIRATMEELVEKRDANVKELSAPHEKCMLCEGSIGNHDKYMAVLSKKLTGYGTQQEYLDACKISLDQLGQQLSDANSRIIDLRREFSEASSSLEFSLRERPKVEESLAKARQYEDYLEAVSRRAQLEARIMELEKELQAVQNETVDGDGSTERLQELKDAVDAGNSALISYMQYDIEQKEALKHAEKALHDAKRLAHSQKVNAQARTMLASLREVFGASRAQAIFLSAKIARLNELLHMHMQAAHMPFELRLDDDQHVFVYTDSTGVEMPACRLSGAQKSMASVALQAALLQTAAPNLALLALDEPAEAADENNVRYMADMLRRMISVLDSDTGTVLVITRNQPLIEAADNIIELGASNED